MVARVPGMATARATIPSTLSVLPTRLEIWLLLVDVADELADFVKLVPGGFAEVEENLMPGGFADIEEKLNVELEVVPSLLGACVGPEIRDSVTVDALGGQMVVKSTGAGASNVSPVTWMQSSEAQQCQSRSLIL